MKSVKDANIQLKELFQNYKKFVSSNPQTISDLETTAKWISYFIAGRISDSSVTSELVYALSNMLVFCNDRIIENSQNPKAEVNPTAQKIKVMLTTLEYTEVFIEIGSRRLWGKKARWYFIVAIQIIKSKVSRDTLYESVAAMLQSSTDKKRNFLETVELQIGLKNYDPQKDKRFSGTVKYVE
uniref:Peroxisomal membrane protein PEX16 n=1 Tax=Megaselia scalaris TaxID=36166 RepID=T1GAQ5_MEGSC